MSKLPRNVKPSRLLKVLIKMGLKITKEEEAIEDFVIQMADGHKYQSIQNQFLKERLEKS